MKKVLAAVLITGLMVVSPVSVMAGGHKGDCSKHEAKASKCKVTKLKGEMKKYWKFADDLELTDEQLGKIADIKHEAMKQLIQQSADVKIIKVDVTTAMWAKQIDTGKVNKLIDQKYNAKNKLAKTYVQALADAQAVLNDDQRAMMQEKKLACYLGKSDCGKCGGGKVCPITGKKLEGKGSGK